MLSLIAALQPLVAQIAELTRQIRAALQDHPDGRTFRSLFKDPKSAVCAATMLAEIGDSRERYPSYCALAGDSGQAPVAVQSGKSKRARLRWACDHRLRDAIATMADTSRHHKPLGQRHLHPRPSPRRQPPTRNPHPRPRMDPNPLAHLARAHHYNPTQHTAHQHLITQHG